MSDKPELAPASKTTAKPHKIVLGSILPVVALGLSLFSLFTSRTTQRDVARIEAVKTEYGLFNDLARQQLEHPRMMHLFANTNESYDADKEAIRAATMSISATERAELLLQERALAHYIFTAYEETFYLWKQASEGEQGRSEFLKEDMQYFNEYLCSNPRMLWYWDAEQGGKLSQQFGGDLRTYYEANVTKGCPTPKDPQGPLSTKEGASK